jgi:chemotaxis methyl-accepting protein methylase
MAKGKKREQNDSGDNTQQQGPSFPLVGIGASAGGLDALKEFFAAVEPDNGMAYVVVVHMAPDHTSSMPQIVGRVARIPVAEAKDGERIQPDHVYFAPPGKEVCVYDGAIQLIERSDSSPTLTIDPFLRSLAADAGKKAAAVILSGTGGDGSGGVKEVKANDGLVLVQSRDTAEYAGMPNSAVATGVVDMEMKPGAMPAVLVQHFSTERAIATQSVDEQAEQSGKWLPKVFAVIRSQVGHDFAGYKRSTLLRRIHRRMALQRIEDPQEYVDLLHKDRSEVETLFREFLIGVTHFFRDSESFDALRDQALPSLLEEFEQGSTLRVWVAGCSTGEEAYSVAMVIHEALDRMPEKRITFQIFATDIDSWAIQKARGAVYPVSIAADMSEERLKRFFVKESDSFRVRKEIRESVIFSVQDVLRDPPFSRLHLLCCRNLLIYLERPQQDRLLRLFHYTLRPQGILMLGTSESVGGLTRLFGALDAQTKLYRRTRPPRGCTRSWILLTATRTGTGWRSRPRELQGVATITASMPSIGVRLLHLDDTVFRRCAAKGNRHQAREVPVKGADAVGDGVPHHGGRDRAPLNIRCYLVAYLTVTHVQLEVANVQAVIGAGEEDGNVISFGLRHIALANRVDNQLVLLLVHIQRHPVVGVLALNIGYDRVAVVQRLELKVVVRHELNNRVHDAAHARSSCRSRRWCGVRLQSMA